VTHAPDTAPRMSPWRIAAWSVAAVLLLLPLVAMQVTDEVRWTASDFVFAAVLLFVPLGLFELAVRRTGSRTYQAAVVAALAGAFLLLWSNAAVGVTDGPADAGYLGVVALGLLGAVVARFRPRGMALAMGATALAVAAVGVTAWATGLIASHNSPLMMLGVHGFFVALFAASAWLFGQAAPSPDARR